MDEATTFPQFSRLPAELRRMVWAWMLPADVDPPALRFCDWKVYLGSNQEFYFEDQGPEDEQEPIYNWVPDHIVNVQVVFPESAVLFVNREARAVALDWVHRCGYTKQYREETRGHVYTRLWRWEHDLLYVSRTEWEEFCDMLTDGDEDQPNVGVCIRHLALPAFTAYYSISALGVLMESMPNLQSIYAIWDDLPEPRPSTRTQGMVKSMRQVWRALVQPRWELETAWLTEDVVDDEGVTRSETVSGEVSLMATHPVDGRVLGHDVGDLEEWMLEIDAQFKTSEIPDHVWDQETGELTVDILAVKAVLR